MLVFRPARLAVSLLMLIAHAQVCAEDLPSTPSVGWEQGGRMLHLRAEHVLSFSVLETVGKFLNVSIRYTGEDREISALDCRTPSLSKMLKCILGPNASFMITWHEEGRFQGDWARDAFIRILGNAANDLTIADQHLEFVAAAKSDPSPELGRLVQEAGSVDPRRRLKSLDRLAERPERKTRDVVDVFKTALTDANAEVRAKALSSLGLFAPEALNESIDQLMRDKSAQVRGAAVDVLPLKPETQAYFESALLDSDQNVRILARARLGFEDPFNE